MYRYEIYEIEGGYGFHILCNDAPVFIQDYAPDLDGYVKMTQEQASAYAEQIIGRMQEV